MYLKSAPLELAEFFEHCRQNQLKITPQRTAIYYALTAGKTHPSADDVYQKVREAFPTISFDTVNRTMLTFAEVGMVEIIEGNGDPRRFDFNLSQHHHFYCVKCGKIEDFYDETFDNVAVSEAMSQRHLIIGKRIVLKGYCENCRETEQ
jgi:Fur family peroxide stress response transcriptional regulator